MKKRTEEILNLLDEQYGREYICYLNYETPWLYRCKLTDYK